MAERDELFRDLLERNYLRWRGIARCYAGPNGRDDLMQEIAMQVWKSLDSYSGRAKIDTWAYRVAINTALSWGRSARAKAKALTESQVDLSHVPSGGDDAHEEQRILSEFLECLPKLDRAAMLLYLDNVPIPDAAGILGVTEGALRVRLHRIRKLFQNTYCNDGEKRDVR